MPPKDSNSSVTVYFSKRLSVTTTTPITTLTGDTVSIFPNGSCAPSSEYSYPQDVGPDEVMRERILLRIPMWVFATCTSYTAVMLSLHAWRKKTEKDEQYIAVLRLAVVFAAWFTALNSTYTAFAVFLEVSQITTCITVYRIESAIYAVNISVIYTALWLRQRVLYHQHSLRVTVSKVTSFFSFTTIFLVISLPITNAAMFFAVLRFCFDERVHLCRVAIQRGDSLYKAYVVIEYVVPVIVPLSLLGFFAWPIVQYHRNKAKTEVKMMRIMRRILIATAVCLLTDVGTVVCNDKCSEAVSPTFRNFSLFANMTSLVLSFGEWKTILFPMIPRFSLTKLDSGSSGN